MLSNNNYLPWNISGKMFLVLKNDWCNGDNLYPWPESKTVTLQTIVLIKENVETAIIICWKLHPEAKSLNPYKTQGIYILFASCQDCPSDLASAQTVCHCCFLRRLLYILNSLLQGLSDSAFCRESRQEKQSYWQSQQSAVSHFHG